VTRMHKNFAGALKQFALGLILSVSFAAVQAAELYGVIGDGGDECQGVPDEACAETLVLIDMTDASSTVVLALGNGADGEEIAYNPDDGLIYHASGYVQILNVDRIMETIDLDTLNVTPVFLSGDEYCEVSALTYAGSGVFIAGDICEGLYSITSGVTSSIGGAEDPTGLAFIGSTLYAVSRNDQLQTLDPSTGASVTSVQIILPDFSVILATGLATNPDDGSLWALLRVEDDVKDYGKTRALVTINPETGLAALVGITDVKGMAGITFVSPDPEMICELKVHDEETALHFETFNEDPELFAIWNSLFGVDPGELVGGTLTLQEDRTVTWPAGSLEMGGLMRLEVRSDRNDPGYKKLKISNFKSKKSKKSKQSKKSKKSKRSNKSKEVMGTAELVSATGSLNPNIADGGWHEVKIKGLDGVMVSLGDQGTVTGYLKELNVKLDKSSSTLAPIVKDFKLELEGMMTIPDVRNGTIDSVVVSAPGSSAIAIAGTQYREKIKGSPEPLNGHTEAEHEEDMIGEIFLLREDGFNDKLKERKGPCSVGGT